MVHYEKVTPSAETRRLCWLACEVASLKLNVAPSPLFFVREDPDGRLALPRRVRGFTLPDAGGTICIHVRYDQSPEALVNTCFHETHHISTLAKEIREGGSLPAREITEGQADWFATCEAPTGSDYGSVLSNLLAAGVEECIQRDFFGAAAEFLRILEQHDPKAAAPFKARVEKLIKIDAKLNELDDGWISPSQKHAENARFAAEYGARVDAERRTRREQQRLNAPREAAERAAREAKEREQATRRMIQAYHDSQETRSEELAKRQIKALFGGKRRDHNNDDEDVRPLRFWTRRGMQA